MNKDVPDFSNVKSGTTPDFSTVQSGANSTASTSKTYVVVSGASLRSIRPPGGDTRTLRLGWSR